MTPRYYSLFTLGMLVMFECTVVAQRQRNLRELRSLQTPKQRVKVYRGGKWEVRVRERARVRDLCVCARVLRGWRVPPRGLALCDADTAGAAAGAHGASAVRATRRALRCCKHIAGVRRRCLARRCCPVTSPAFVGRQEMWSPTTRWCLLVSRVGSSRLAAHPSAARTCVQRHPPPPAPHTVPCSSQLPACRCSAQPPSPWAQHKRSVQP